MSVVSNSSPLIWLARLGKLSLLESLFGKVFFPKSIYDEVVEVGLTLGKPEAVEIRDAVGKWLFVSEPTRKVGKSELSRTLHKGEIDAIVMAKEKSLPVLMDERPGTRAARVFGIETIGTLRIIMMALENDLASLNEAKGLIDELVSQGFRLSAAERDRALTLLEVVARQKKD